ncbi:hypothetical protein ACN28E_54995 [Archangium lansingense]|uniref:hypothetical protein n=1 Tax=Archangium lansingense TaxID=2995310 RepID=UPI003B77F3F8
MMQPLFALPCMLGYLEALGSLVEAARCERLCREEWLTAAWCDGFNSLPERAARDDWQEAQNYRERALVVARAAARALPAPRLLSPRAAA